MTQQIKQWTPLAIYDGGDGSMAKASPEAWLDQARRGGGLVLVDDIREQGTNPIPVAIGDIVEFAWYAQRGTATITLDAAGTVTVTGDIPADTNTFVIDLGDETLMNNPQGDTLADVLDSFSEAKADLVAAGIVDTLPLLLGAGGVANMRLDCVDERLTFVEVTE